MRSRLFHYFPWILIITLIAVTGLVVYVYSTNVALRGGVREFGPMILGKEAPFGQGSGTFHPYLTVPKSKFYITVAEEGLFCILEDCALAGALVHTMGGWLQGEKTGDPTSSELLGLDRDTTVASIIVMSDGDNKIVGIYPNKGLKDVLPILRLHPDLVDFSLLKGVDAFGPLKIGAPAPLKPGDPTGYRAGEPDSYPFTHIPSGKKFYVFSFQKELFGREYCAFYECESPEDYPNGSSIEDLGGWFSSDGTPETTRKFGLDPGRIAAGEASLVVVTDSVGTLVAIHPDKTIKDILSILRQHPEIADIEQLFE